MKAAIYLRVSTADQRTDSQLAEIEAVARLRGFEPTVFRDTASGGKFTRAGLDAMMAEVRRGRLRAVFCFKLDRLGRSLPHLAQLIGEMDRCGCGLVVPSQGIDTVDRDNPAARLQLNVLMAVAEFERSIIRERTNAGIAAAKARGRIGGRPKGGKVERVADWVRAHPGATVDDAVAKWKCSRRMVFRARALAGQE